MIDESSCWFLLTNERRAARSIRKKTKEKFDWEEKNWKWKNENEFRKMFEMIKNARIRLSLATERNRCDHRRQHNVVFFLSMSMFVVDFSRCRSLFSPIRSLCDIKINVFSSFVFSSMWFEMLFISRLCWTKVVLFD